MEQIIYDELAPLSATDWERLLHPRRYPFGECVLTLPEYVMAKRSLYTAAFTEAFALAQLLVEEAQA